MKQLKLIPIMISFVFLNGMTAFSQDSKVKKPEKGFALLEMYTSEGCSSCPPADELMGKLQAEYKEKNVYILAYHVDYWDRQGWKDIFSNADYTKRQYEYAKYLGKEPIYTPQLIVNGKEDYVGSQETSVRDAIKVALARPSITDLSLDADVLENKLNVRYGIKKASKNSRLVLAVVQRLAKSNVKRGENANRVLSHYQIVRQLHSVALTDNLKGSTSLSLPKGFNTKEYEVIGFIQDRSSGAILGAERAAVD